MSVTASYELKLSVRETLEAGVDAANAPVITHAYENNGTLRGSTSVPATKQVADTIPLVAGAKTIDLTALTGTNGSTVDGSGLKVQVIKITNKGAAAMTFTPGASNGYLLLGTAWKVILDAGQSFMAFLNDKAPDIDATHKNIDVAGTGTESLELHVVMG